MYVQSHSHPLATYVIMWAQEIYHIHVCTISTKCTYVHEQIPSHVTCVMLCNSRDQQGKL